MKAYLTEWLIRHGTGWVDGALNPGTTQWYIAHNAEYIDRTDYEHPAQERISPKGLEYLKNESIPD